MHISNEPKAGGTAWNKLADKDGIAKITARVMLKGMDRCHWHLTLLYFIPRDCICAAHGALGDAIRVVRHEEDKRKLDELKLQIDEFVPTRRLRSWKTGTDPPAFE
jgi:hypothetical protein